MWTLSQAALDVLAERRGQVEREGWTPEHDDQHSVEELQKAGVAYASIGVCVLPEIFWPWGRDWWKPKGLRQNLVRGAALLIAAIERLDRQQTANVGGEARLAAHRPSRTTTATPQGVASTDELGRR